MALANENGGIPATMLVGPTSGMPYWAGGNQGGNGMFDNGSGWWILLLFILLGAGNWGNNGFSGNGGEIQRGFDQASVMNGFTGVNAGLNGISNALCSGFAGVNATVNAGVNSLAQQMFAAQMADMQNAFNMQSQFANCCCENRLGLANLNATVLAENCADRAAVSDGIRDILVNQNANTQRILDQMCNDKIDAKNEKIADLERQLTMANLAASQTAQTSRILADNAAQTVALEQYLNPVPVPAYVVQNPNCCAQNYGCGCGVA